MQMHMQVSIYLRLLALLTCDNADADVGKYFIFKPFVLIIINIITFFFLLKGENEKSLV